MDREKLTGTIREWLNKQGDAGKLYVYDYESGRGVYVDGNVDLGALADHIMKALAE